MAGILQSIISRILPSGLSVRFRRSQTTEYFKRQQSYWQSNSIYLDNIYNKIATDVAMMQFKHVKITRNEDEQDTWKWFEHSDLARVVGISPNENESPLVFWANVIRVIVEDGVAVVVPVHTNGRITSLQLADGEIEYNGSRIAITIGEEVSTVDIGDVWIFENPKQNLSTQLGRITRIIDDNLHALSEKVNDGKGSSLNGLLHMPTALTDENLQKRAEQRVNNIYETAKSGGIGYLGKDEEFQELTREYRTADSSELEFLKAQLYQAFGINEQLFTCDYSEQQYRAYYQSVVKVYVRLIREEINRKYFTLTAQTQGHRLLVYMDIFDITSLKDLNEFAFKMKYSGILNANELREIFGYGSYDGGNTYETNRNAVPISDTNNLEI